MKRIQRDRPVSPLEAEKYTSLRRQIAEELPDLIEGHQQRLAESDRDLKLLEIKNLILSSIVKNTYVFSMRIRIICFWSL